MMGRLFALNTSSATTTRMTSPTSPTAIGLRSDIDFIRLIRGTSPP